ncbi:MAG: hypothetical protein JO102_05790, partial [Elusimicrobia bacterium]|nr:hypothetical protein [Elusimicrobiota bacterium]
MTEQTPGARRVWMIVCLTLLVFFAATRFFDLTSRPLHHDEGVNGVFLRNLIV